MSHNIDKYGFGQITIDGEEYEEDVIITPGSVMPKWWRREGHEVSVFDLAEALADKPARLIIGTGVSGMCKVLPEVEDYCRTQGIDLLIAPTPEAVVEYNSLEDKGGTVAALHLTC